MKLNLDKFLPKLTLVNSVVNAKAVIPIQGDFLLRTENGKLYVNASDGENTVSVSVEPTEYSDLCVCVNATDLFKALSNLRGEEIEIVLNEDKHLLRCVYKSGYFQLPYEYDKLASAVLEIQHEDMYHIDLNIDAADLSEAILKAEIASAEDNVRPQFNGVHIDFKQDGMVAVATDTNKMSKFVTNIKTDGDTPGFTIQKKSAHILTMLTESEDTVNMKVGDKNVLFKGDGFTMTTRLSEYPYPNYNALIPTDNTLSAIINKESILNAIKRVSPMGSEKDELLKMTFGNNTIIIEAEDVMFGKLAKEKLECKYDGEQIAVGVNSRNIVALIQAMDDDEFEFSFKTPRNAIVIKPLSDLRERFTTLIMPLILHNNTQL